MPKAPYVYNPDPLPYIHLPAGWDATWKAGKAGGSPNIMTIGDSVEQGQGMASNGFAGTWPGVLKASLLSTLGLSLAAEYVSVGHSLDANYGSIPGSPWSAFQNGVTPTLVTYGGWHRYFVMAGSIVGAYQTFTTPVACTALDLFYVDLNPGSFQYFVDGGGGVTVTCTGGGTAATTSVKKVSVSGLANTTHTLAWGSQAGVNQAQVLGAAYYPSGTAGTGLRFSRLSIGGAGAFEWDSSNAAQLPADRIRLYKGVSPQSDAGAGNSFGFPLNPHLVILGLHINDWVNNKGWDLESTTLSRFIRALQAGPNAPSIAFAIKCMPDGNTSDCAYPWHNNIDLYKRPMYILAAQYGCAVVDIDKKWGATPVAKGFLPAADLHPLAAGHSDIAAVLASIL